MRWNPSEMVQAASVCQEMQKDSCCRSTVIQRSVLELRVSDAGRLRGDLSIPSSYGLLFMRHLFEGLTFDVKRPLRWRLEHKLVQAHVLNHYFPGCVPLTIGLRGAVAEGSCRDIMQRVTEHTESEFLVKPALGYGSGERREVDQFKAARETLGTQSRTLPTHLEDEDFIIQERVEIAEEFRVHSIEDLVIEDLTFSRYARRTAIPDGKARVNAFVQSVLNALPNTLIKDTLYGWDVALTTAAEIRIIEANPSGYLPCYVPPGFHCSGYLTLPSRAPTSIAHLLQFIRRRYGVTISVIPDAARNTKEQAGYWWIAQCAAILERHVSCTQDGGAIVTKKIACFSYDVDFTLSAEQNIFRWAVACLGGNQTKDLPQNAAQQIANQDGSLADGRLNTEPTKKEVLVKTHERQEHAPDQSGSVYTSPGEATMTHTEKALRDIWLSLFPVTQIGLDDDFFDLGGDSVIATQCVHRLHNVLGVDLPVDTFFAESATVKEIAKVIDELRSDDAR